MNPLFRSFPGKCVLLVVLGVTSFNGWAASPSGPASYPDRLTWWGEARFGLFIHWGSVSLKGTEIGWSRGGDRRGYGSKGNQVPSEIYDNLYKEFNPTNFNAREWVALAKAAGMKYLVFTSRHHDGFSMFDTQASDYKITSPQSPFRRDVVKELADACHVAVSRWRSVENDLCRHSAGLGFPAEVRSSDCAGVPAEHPGSHRRPDNCGHRTFREIVGRVCNPSPQLLAL